MNSVRLYQQEDDRYIKSWYAAGPGCTVGGYNSPELALKAYVRLATLNKVDVSQLAIVYGNYKTVWVEEETVPLSLATIVKQEEWLKKWEASHNFDYSPEMLVEAAEYVNTIEWLTTMDDREGLTDVLAIMENENGPVSEEELAAAEKLWPKDKANE